MTCVNYNLLKEGFSRNFETTVSGALLLGSEEFAALYDNDTATPAFTLNGSPQFLHIEHEFGEAFSVCYVRYYSNETNANRIRISYRNNEESNIALSVFEEDPGIFRADIDQYVRFIDVLHTVSGTSAEVYQFEVYGTRNEKLGFGTAIDQVDYYRASHSTANAVSASANAIPIFNDSQYDDVAKVSIAPTLTEVDKYLRMSPTRFGTFYGINEYGFSHPAPNPITLVDDPMSSTTLHPQWELRRPAQRHQITSTADGLVFNLDYEANMPGTSTAETTGLYSKESFTAHSFTAEVQVRFLSLTPPPLTDAGGRDFIFVLTNSYPIPDVGYTDSWTTDNRRGASVVGISLSPDAFDLPDEDTLIFRFRWVDGSYENDRSGEVLDYRWTSGNGSGFFAFDPKGEVDEVEVFSLGDLSDIVNGGETFAEFTSSAEWHTLRLTYDHLKKEVIAFADNIMLGRHAMSIEPFGEACRLFIGLHGNGGLKWALRNFRITKDLVYRQVNVASPALGGSAMATISGSTADKLIDGDVNTSYVAPNPNTNTHIRVDFSSPQDVAFYVLTQHDAEDGVSAFGKNYFADVARQAFVDFGGKKFENHVYPSAGGVVRRSPTYSGSSHTVASGISYIDFQFIDYDETSHTNGALIIDSVEVYAEERVSRTSPTAPNSITFPWVRGRWNNLRQYGTSSALALKDRRFLRPSYHPIPEHQFEGVDYGFSSAVVNREFGDIVNEYHHGGTLFYWPDSVGAGQLFTPIVDGPNSWSSNTQNDNFFYVWRYFHELSNVKAVYWDSRTVLSSHVADEFKFQYLSEDGDPNNENDWIDFPIIHTQHPYTGGSNSADTNYKNYRNYLITNNDGEYYVNYYNLSTFGSGFCVGSSSSSAGVPKGLAVPNGYVSDRCVILSSEFPTGNGLAGYVEFEEAVATRGFRMVIRSTIESGFESGVFGTTGQEGTVRTDIGLSVLEVYRTNGAGSYTSPVFDTGTRQNTERVSAEIKQFGDTSSTVFVRSFSDPPSYTYNPKYEVWESLGTPGNTTIDFGSTTRGDRAVTRDGITYFIKSSNTKKYTHATDAWANFVDYPTSAGFTQIDTPDDSGSGFSGVEPDVDEVHNHTALIGSRIYVAARTTADNPVARLMYYDFEDELSQWVLFGTSRPPLTEDAAMAADPNRERIYFFNQDGSVFYYDVSQTIWVQLGVLMPTFSTVRKKVGLTEFDDRIYIFGGHDGDTGLKATTIFDLNTQTFRSGADAPYRIDCCQVVPVPEERVIYVFPVKDINAVNFYRPTMKYHVDSDSWELCESLMWYRDLGDNHSNLADYHFYYNGYIYRMMSDLGLSRTYVRRDSWSSATFPDIRDPVWGAKNGRAIPWIKSDSFGEFMPQERYLQFKVELYSDDLVNSPVLESVTAVIPHDVPVPASGTANVYVKVGVAPEETFQAWYSAQTSFVGSGESIVDEDFGVLYTQSSDGLSWGIAATVSGSWDDTTDSSTTARRTLYSPWVIKESETSYKYWFTRDYVNDSADDDAEIYYSNTTSALKMSGDFKVVAKGALTESANGAKYPCVIKESASSYKMWYTGLSSTGVYRIIYATSTNGTSWSGHTLSLNINNRLEDSAGVYRPFVIKEGSTYRMWYTGVGSDGYERILYTTSSDGITWTFPQVAIDIASEGDLDLRGSSKAAIVVDVDEYIAYYVGYDGTYYSIIRASSADGVIWDNFTLAVPAGGLIEFSDGGGLGDFFVILNKELIVPGSLIEGAQIKLYNEGAAV